MPIEKVDTPKGFNITPAEAINPLMARSSRVSWSDFYLFIDNIKAL
ncbi:MAG: hypothetical protein KAI72_01620 [Candidatus Pacebacteria bacterium]|nr:hypothetical protein [Candidatus Paceibacterota bacterium]